MDTATFAAIVDEFVQTERDMLGLKAGEYSSGGDRLWNFHRAAELLGKRPSEVALDYLTKHYLAIVKAVMEGTGGWDWRGPDHAKAPVEGLKQRIADARNYLLLMAACLEEERWVDALPYSDSIPAVDVDRIKNMPP